jgi:pSer/pThr/pTyr-binding forkhead associated (FHA) protein
MAKLILQFKGANIKEFLLEKTSITIGRDPKNDIVIDNLAVSRFHTKITHHDNNYLAEDLQSGNGTFLNEQRVAKEVLKHNDAITVGKHTLVFMYDPVFPATELGEAATSLLEETVIVSSESPYGSADAEGALSAHLVRLASGTPPQSVPLTKLITLGGKGAQADIQLRGFFVGAVAFSISKTPRGFVISHAGGKRRTRVNGEVVEHQRELREGDLITIGPTKFRFSRENKLVG